MHARHKLFILSFLGSCLSPAFSQVVENDRYFTLVVDPHKENIKMYWKDDHGKLLNTFNNLEAYLKTKGKKLRFAMNGGMFFENYTPMGLYVHDGELIMDPNNRTMAHPTNFYTKPNGAFLITTKNDACIVMTESLKRYQGHIKEGTQSGMLLVWQNGTGKTSTTTIKGEKYIRNAVGIRQDGKVVFVISKVGVTIKELTDYFLTLHCAYALHLDGVVSDYCFPERNINGNDRDFGVIIAVIK